jgi:hypothetical protein
VCVCVCVHENVCMLLHWSYCVCSCIGVIVLLHWCYCVCYIVCVAYAYLMKWSKHSAILRLTHKGMEALECTEYSPVWNKCCPNAIQTHKAPVST